MHEFDMILLKEHSVLLYGKDYRKRLFKHRVFDSSRDINRHIANNMLPKILADLKGQDNPTDKILSTTFLMSRNVYIVMDINNFLYLG
jgi:hypothetical protein